MGILLRGSGTIFSRVEKILNIAGEVGNDPTAPRRSEPFPQSLNGLSTISRRIEKSSLSLGLSPFRLPLSINYSSNSNHGEPCIGCGTCDTFACAIRAKNDLATTVLPSLVEKGLHLTIQTVAIRFQVERNRVVALECYDKSNVERKVFYSERYILSAGALSSPHLLLASGLHFLNSGGHAVGHYLMRHCSAIVYGVFPQKISPLEEFHKQIGILDFYFGHPSVNFPNGKLGSIQQIQSPPLGLIHASIPKPFGRILGFGKNHLTGLLILAEDQPQYQNFVTIDRRKMDRFGLPQLLITHRHSNRDYAARDVLIEKARRILRHAGARFFYVYPMRSFSHAVGTVRMGENPESSALDEYCQFRGIENLFVVDGSFMPTSAGLNPSLTIAANALRVGEFLKTMKG